MIKNAFAYAGIWAIALGSVVVADFVIGEYSLLVLFASVYLASAFCRKVFDGTPVRQSVKAADYVAVGVFMVVFVLFAMGVLFAITESMAATWILVWANLALGEVVGDLYSHRPSPVSADLS